MTGQLSALAQGKAAGAPAGYTSKLSEMYPKNVIRFGSYSRRN